MKAIELRTAFAFDCDNCGKENFVRGIVHEFSQEEIDDLKDKFGIDRQTIGDWMTIPEVVECQYCKTQFLSLNYRD